MPISPTPIIPLYRVQASPEARFQRFGVNDSQLFGKPLNGAAEAPSGLLRLRMTDRAQPRVNDKDEPGPAPSRPSLPEPWIRLGGYDKAVGKPGMADLAPKIGSNLDVTA